MDKIAGDLGAMMSFGNQLKNYQVGEGALLDRLEKLPVKEVESRAKAEGSWYSGSSSRAPAPGDLVTFSSGENSQSPHIGIVAGAQKDGQLPVITGIRLKPAEPNGNYSSGVSPSFQTQSIKSSDLRGIISKPPAVKGTPTDKSLGPLRQTLTMHENLTHLMGSLLSSASPQDSNGTKTSR